MNRTPANAMMSASLFWALREISNEWARRTALFCRLSSRISRSRSRPGGIEARSGGAGVLASPGKPAETTGTSLLMGASEHNNRNDLRSLLVSRGMSGTPAAMEIAHELRACAGPADPNGVSLPAPDPDRRGTGDLGDRRIARKPPEVARLPHKSQVQGPQSRAEPSTLDLRPYIFHAWRPRS